MRFSLVLLAVSIALAPTARAVDPVRDLDVVEVVGHTLLDATGVPLSEMPANVQVLKAGAAREQGASNLADALNSALGSVSVSNGTGNPYQNDVNIRGYQATSILGAPVGVSVYFDGVRMNEPFGSNVNWELIPMEAADSISLLPGSNPMFGLNTLGGALVVTSRNGRDDRGASLGVHGGSFGRKAAATEAGWVDAARAMDYFLSANVDAQSGYRVHSGSRISQFYGKARWHGDDPGTVLELSTSLVSTAVSGTQSLPVDMLSDPAAAYTWPDRTSHRAGFANLKGRRWLTGQDELAGNLYFRRIRSSNLNSNAGLDDDCGDCVDRAPHGTAANAVTGASALALGYGQWTDAINTSLVHAATSADTLGASFQWSHSGSVAGSRHALVIGALADRSRIGYGQDSVLARLVDHGMVATPNQAYGFTADGLPPSSTNKPVFSASPVISAVRLSSTTRDLSIYATDTLHPTERLNVTVSGSYNITAIDQAGENARYLADDGGYAWTDEVSGLSWYNPAYVAAYAFSNSGTGAAALPNGVPIGSRAGPETNGLDGRHRYRRFNPAVGFNYNIDRAVGLFGGYSEAMRAPTSIELSCADPANPCSLPTGFNGDPDLKAVVARTLELGGRGQLADHISWNAALYRSRLDNDIQFIATASSYGYFANIGQTERRGAELGLQGRIGKLFLSGNAGYVEAVYRSAFVTATGESVVPGNRMPGVPARSLKARASFAATPALSLGGTFIAVGSQYSHGNEGNGDPQGRVAGHAIVNADIDLRLGASLRLSLQVSNLFDRRYATYGLSGMTSIYTLQEQLFVTPAPPRAVWAGLAWKWP
ncbi:MAG: hypothetical protein RLZZ393_954 [Pseudomonadota bacterium]|jgi:outer membrane receptor protein involved in Fe transport